jgi:hypothetical membrane protein
LLWGVFLSPVFYYVGLLGGALLYPGYSHVTQYASELGSASAPYPAFFNLSAIACGLSAIVGAFALGPVIVSLGGKRGWAYATAVTLVLWGAAVIMAGLFPMPNELHGAYGLGMAGQLTPLLAWLALRPVKGLDGLKIFLLAIFFVSLAFFAIMMGVGGLVTRANVGLWQRGNSLFGIGWLLVFGWSLLRRTDSGRRPA